MELGRPRLDLALDLLVEDLQGRLSLGDAPHLSDAPATGPDQEDILEDDPAGMLDPPPRLDHRDAVDRLRPEEPAQQMIRGDDDRGRDQDGPVAVEGEEGQRAEDVEVGLDPASGEMDQQGAGEHLCHGDGVPRQGPRRSRSRQRDGEADEPSPEQDGRPDMRMHLARCAGPGAWRDDQRGDDGGHPLEGQQACEQDVGGAEEVVAVLVEQGFGAARHVHRRRRSRLYGGHRASHPRRGYGVQKIGQPKTGVSGGGPELPRSRERMVSRPRLSPSCPRPRVIPPRNRRRPSGA